MGQRNHVLDGIYIPHMKEQFLKVVCHIEKQSVTISNSIAVPQ